MAVERINGTKINFNTLSDSEVQNLIDYQTARVQQVNADMAKILGEAGLRGLIPLEIALGVEA